jgi:E3 ubiquitin-protein ligase SIAH1
MSAHDRSKDVLEQLECPVYTQYMLPPNMFCCKGHNICSSCKQKIQKCPTCREPLLNTRNKALEKLAIPVECPCPNKPHGCTLTFPIALTREHEDVSQFGPFDCLLKFRIKCNWTGPLTEIKGHVLHKHKDHLRGTYIPLLELTKPTVRRIAKIIMSTLHNFP